VDRVLRCDCGFEVRGAHEDTLVAQVQRHALEAHGMALSHDEALVLAFRTELEQDPPRRPSAGRRPGIAGDPGES
jgi:hypothetical protein